MTDQQIVVIGRGIAGLAAAYELKKAGFPVHVVGPARRDEPLGVGTRAATGVSALKGAVLPQKDLFAAKAAGHTLLPGWLAEVEAASGIIIPRLFTGMSELFFDLMEYEGIRKRVFHRKFTGCYRAEVFNINTLLKVAGDLSASGFEPVGGFFYPRDGWYSPDAVLLALEVALKKRGVPFTDDTVQSLTEHSDQGLKVNCQNRSLLCSEAILATGVWTDGILERSGLKGMPAQKAFAGETLKGPGGGELVTSFAKTTFVAYGGQIQFGSTCYPASTLFEGPTAIQIEGLRQKLAKRAPLPAFSEVCFGLRARSADRLPTLGPLFFPSGNRRLWLLAGLYKNGLQLAPLFGQVLARMLRLPTVSGPFLPARFL